MGEIKNEKSLIKKRELFRKYRSAILFNDELDGLGKVNPQKKEIKYYKKK